ncbi:Cu(I)-responsive transcriptional regulator [Litorivicinus lipolyticus]|uniref:Cu(I)-responsive transcriptional regulator n=1 Tax=Litorivicinus lipolyticus TaxID=418701 RepID=UPI003B5B3E87
MKISQAANAAGLSAKTLRYYESVGLVSFTRDSNGYRVLGDGDIQTLEFIAHARALGFSITECRELLSLYADDSRASADVKAMAQVHLTAIDKKIHELAHMRDTIAELVNSCAGDQRPDCPILDGIKDLR